VAAAIETLRRCGTRELALLHCVSRYPTPLAEANLRCIGTLAASFGCPVGYSDHTLETTTGSLAVRAGACLLEKHFTLDRSLPGPDQQMSLDPVQLAAYIRQARTAARGNLAEATLTAAEQSALGDGVKAPSAGEGDVRRVARSSVTTEVFIPAGTPLTRAMLTVKRPGGGVPPAEIDALPGRVAAQDIPADTTLLPEMLR
jgi:sialic acid synthase SpsE